MSVRYRDAGVDLDLAGALTTRITQNVGNGLFGGFFPLSSLAMYEEPVLVSSIDGVGTKVYLAARLGMTDGLGKDIVHHCVNDIAVHGARPLFFMDYLAFNRLDPPLVEGLVASIADACRALDIALAGGETAEMPLVYPEGRFDVAGAIVGVVDRAEILDGGTIRAGDVLLALPAAGLHTNGYSLVQQIFEDGDYQRYEPALGATLGEALLGPHRCYLDEVRLLIKTGTVHGLAHITGGGIEGNLARILPDDLRAVVVLPEPPPIYDLLAARGIAPDEMRRVFNMGIGMIAVCDPKILAAGPTLYPTIGYVEPVGATFCDRSVIIRDGN